MRQPPCQETIACGCSLDESRELGRPVLRFDLLQRALHAGADGDGIDHQQNGVLVFLREMVEGLDPFHQAGVHHAVVIGGPAGQQVVHADFQQVG